MRFAWIASPVWVAVCALASLAADGNRLTYLDAAGPYQVSLDSARLTTPQWVGEPGVEAVVVLAIDDMRGHAPWEAYLRPILDRLKQIEGQAALSIMTVQVAPDEPHLHTWLAEGVSLETHTSTHPCPLLAGGNLAAAKADYDRCVDLMARVPGSRPVAFRMPCCDSLNTVSPRFFAEIFDRATPAGNYLAIDTSVFQIPTPNDPELPRRLVFDADGRERFRKYIPADRSFVNTIEDYPYPYVIGRLCWEFPCATPSDWQAQNLQRAANPRTVADMQAAIDATVVKRGVFNLVFHPYEWIRNDQIVSLIDHAAATHGRRVKFLNFREALARLEANVLGGQSLRAANGQDNGARLLDLNGDGFMDAVIGNDQVCQTRLWSPQKSAWTTLEFPTPLVEVSADGTRRDAGVRFGILGEPGQVVMIVANERQRGAWRFAASGWVADDTLLAGLTVDGAPLLTCRDGHDEGVRLRDLDRDGACELLAGNDRHSAVFQYDGQARQWRRLPFGLPAGTSIVDSQGRDAGLRFVDLDEDAYDDVLFANERTSSIDLFRSASEGWSRRVMSAAAGSPTALPPVALAGTDNGAWFHSRHLWLQNETTDRLKNLVDRRSFAEMLKDVEPESKSPAASLRAMRVRPGFRVELVAAEPLVVDPVAFDWGPDGRLWVVEMRDYPTGMDGQGKPGGRIKVLEDTDGDGRYDRGTVFLDELGFPSGVMAWRQGVLVTCAPEILYAEDTDGDGRADVRRTLYRGFGEGNQQHRVNGLRWGLDNWIYCANGDSGGEIESLATGEKTGISFRDFRIRPDTGQLQAEIGLTQFVRERDDWGHWFGSQNSEPMFQFVLPDHYLRRNRHVAAANPRHNVSIAPGAAPVFPVSRTLPRFNDFNVIDRFTSACSAIIYRDDLLGARLAGNTFVCEPVHNLVHREVMSRDGVRYTSRRADDEQQSEFLASSDNWFRPTMVRTGPDGALWIADMYRAVIEHPEYIPQEWQARLNLRAGDDMGRIYRVFPVGTPPRDFARLDRLDTAGLVAALDTSNGWQRDTAHQMLLWRNDRAAVPLLVRLAREGGRPVARLHSLCVLDGLESLDAETLLAALGDSEAGVRQHAVRLSEPWLAKTPRLAAQVAELAADADPQVRMQVAFSLGEWPDRRAGEALARIALADHDDPHIPAAVMSSVGSAQLDGLVAVVFADPSVPPPVGLVQMVLTLAAAYDNQPALVRVLTVLADKRGDKFAPWQLASVAALLDTLDRRDKTLAQFRAAGSAELAAAIERLAPMFAAARRAALDDGAAEDERAAALLLLGRGLDERESDLRVLTQLLTPRSSGEVQQAAIAAISKLDVPQVPAALLAGWKGYGPEIRAGVLDAVMRRGEWLGVLLDQLESGLVPLAEIDAARRQRLLDHRDEAIRGRAEKLLAATGTSTRQAVVDEYRAGLPATADPERGAAVFKKSCSVCHRLGELGTPVGPDLAALTDKSPQAMLVAVLDPNRAVESKFVNYTAVTTAGLTYTGMLASETGASVTLLGQEGKQTTILRNDLEELTSSSKSLMPEGLEKDLTRQDLADLIVFLGKARPPRRVFDGNEPKTIEPEGFRGEFWLLASDAEIYGETLVYEPVYRNLGFWSSQSDHAVWTFDVREAGKYIVRIDYACAEGGEGNAYQLIIGDTTLAGKVASTGNWDTYRQATVGVVTLRPGEQQLVLRPAGKIDGYLMDLKSVRVTPVAND